MDLQFKIFVFQFFHLASFSFCRIGNFEIWCVFSKNELYISQKLDFWWAKDLTSMEFGSFYYIYKDDCTRKFIHDIRGKVFPPTVLWGVNQQGWCNLLNNALLCAINWFQMWSHLYWTLIGGLWSQGAPTSHNHNFKLFLF